MFCPDLVIFGKVELEMPQFYLVSSLIVKKDNGPHLSKQV